MLKTVTRLTPTFIFSIIERRNENDYDNLNRPPTDAPKTGMDRVKQMFRRNAYFCAMACEFAGFYPLRLFSLEVHKNKIYISLYNGVDDLKLTLENILFGINNFVMLNTILLDSTADVIKHEYDEISVEVSSIVQSALCGAFAGACFGGLIKSRQAYLYFIENNQATIFKSTMEAKKKLQDHVTIAFAKGAYHWGWRLSIFTGMFTLVSTTISVYYGETSLMDYMVAGAITGAVYKANLGLAATLVGAGLGCVLSTAAGLIIISVLKTTGITMDDIRKSLYKIKQAREQQYAQAKEKAATIKHDDLTRHHDTLVLEKGEKAVKDLN